MSGSLALSFVCLGLVCLAAYLFIKWLNRRGHVGDGWVVRVVGRCGLEPKRSVYVVEAGGRFFLLGVGEGPMAMLAELDGSKVIASQKAVSRPFADVLASVLRPAPRTPAVEPVAAAAEPELSK